MSTPKPPRNFWTREQDTYIITNWHLPLADLAAAVGHSEQSVAARHIRLRKDMTLPYALRKLVQQQAQTMRRPRRDLKSTDAA